MKKVWVVARNDLEAVEIIRLLQAAGETVLVSQQAWGACWENLEDEITSGVEGVLQNTPAAEVIGIELAGTPRWHGRNIDHHRWGESDRSCEHSSLEQVALLLGHHLNRYEALVAANDKGWIPALVAAGATPGEVETVRMADRCAQGVSPDQEAQAVRDIAAAEWRGRKVLVRCPDGSSSAITDRLYGRYDEAITTAPDKWIYYGPRAQQIHQVVRSAGLGHARDWTGGSAAFGYAGFIAPTAESTALIENIFWQDNLPE